MTLMRFGFVIKGAGYVPRLHRTTLDSGEFKTWIIGVSTLEEARVVIAELVADEVQLIELCGGFTRDNAEELERSVDGRVPVGVVTYSSEQEARLAKLFS